MNGKIKLLSEQAVQLVANERTNGDVSRLNTDSYHVKDLIQQKFAELIIKECIVAHEDYYGGDIISDVLKNHFRVE